VTDPTTDPRDAEAEHRKQEEVLKRWCIYIFWFHSWDFCLHRCVLRIHYCPALERI
jgi:hypothetical protein